jgi:hypothetical protein
LVRESFWGIMLDIGCERLGAGDRVLDAGYWT